MFSHMLMMGDKLSQYPIALKPYVFSKNCSCCHYFHPYFFLFIPLYQPLSYELQEIADVASACIKCN